MSKSSCLRASDIHSLYLLAGECRDLGDDHALWRGHWFYRLAQLTGADLIVGGDVAVGRDGAIRPLCTIEWGWENGFDRAANRRVLSQCDAVLGTSPVLETYFRRHQFEGCGRTRTDLVTDRAWYPTLFFQTHHAPMGIDHLLVSFFTPLGSAGACSGITLSRGKEVRRDFSERARAAVHESQAIVGPLIGGPLARFSEPAPSDLTPRVRDVLRCLLEGDGDKQIAVRLGMSPHTVNTHTKTIYHHFNVQSRAELLARWIRRGWGTRFAWAD